MFLSLHVITQFPGACFLPRVAAKLTDMLWYCLVAEITPLTNTLKEPMYH